MPEGVEVRRELGAGGEVPFDRERFRRALINVVDNACQAMDAKMEAAEGAPEQRLTVASRVVGQRLEVSISDTGAGLAAELSAKVFEPLYSTKAFGVGLGLPMVKQVLEQHGGGVELESEVGVGTRITLWLPQAAEREGTPCDP